MDTPRSDRTPATTAPLARLGRWCHDRRVVVLVLWFAVLAAIGAGTGALGSGFATEFSLPNVESQRGFTILDDAFGGQIGGRGGTIVFEADQGVTDPSVREPMQTFFDELDQLEDVTVVSPYSELGARQIAQQGPLAGKVAYADLQLPRGISLERAHEIRDEVERLRPEIDGVRIELGGQVFADFEPPSSETIGLAFAVVILIVAFGSVIAMGLPIGTAIAGIGVGVGTVTLLSNLFEMPEFTTSLAVMIGLGVGIDYALFIVTRYREELHAGRDEGTAAAIAINTAGRAVLFAGITVVISLTGMLLMGLAFMNGLAVGAAIVVFVTMVASVTLLPALLGFVGERVEVSRWRGVIAAGLIAIGLLGTGLSVGVLTLAFPAALVVFVAGFFIGPLGREVPERTKKPLSETTPYRWSHFIQRHPVLPLVGGLTVLLLVATPVLSLRLGFSDEGNYPEDTTTRQAYDLLAEAFGPGFNGPLIVVTRLPDGADQAALQRVSEALSSDEGVAFASPARPNDPQDPTAAIWQVVPKTAPQAAETEALVQRLRDDVIPGATEGTALDPAVTGGTAVNVDFSDYLGQRLPLFLAVVLSLSFLLLMAVFRSLLVPLKAVIMNVISIGAAYGAAVAVFQWGWLSSLLGVTATGPIEPFVPMMLFAIVFGLSMDYEVFLLSRIKEQYDSGASNTAAVADGLATTARVITAAAAIMVVVFGSFLLESDRILKLFGFGLGVAVLLDASLVRMVLVPATMELLGDRNWWLPRWLDRILPKLDVEGQGLESTEDEDEPEAVHA